MYLLLCLLVGTAYGIPIEEVTRNTNPDLSSQYRLPSESRPTFYDVQLFLNPTTVEFFHGITEIRVLPTVQTNVLVLHAMELDIENITVRRDGLTTDLYVNHTLATDDTHLLRINLNTVIDPAIPHIIHVEYKGTFAENMFGIYKSTYQENGQTEYLITSQLQPTFARRVFPCYDEPHLKAIFRTTIFAPEGFDVVRYNTPQKTESSKEDVIGWVKYEFEDTLVMSTYLNAYLVSNFEHISNEGENQVYEVPMKIFSRPGTKDQAEFALEFAEENMKALEEYTQFPYAFTKLDKVAVPDFAAGAMENWGLVIYREVALLVKEGVTTTNIKQNIARIISHENMHMWFGNEVSPLSWTYTWLNEGFANFFENYATDLVRSEYRMMDQYLILMQDVMQSDAVLSVNPMTHPVYTPSQIIGTFNAVAYQKSGSVIRMLQHVMTPDVFQQGIIKYLRTNSRQAVGPVNLYIALEEALQESEQTVPLGLTNFMNLWTTQGGFPVLTARRTAPTANSIFVSQERYLTDPSQSSGERWVVPINWVLSTNTNFTDTKPDDWVLTSFPVRSYDIPGLAEAEWFILNKQQTGYYRVNYEPDNWEALAKALSSSHQDIHLLNRAQLIDDSFNLARTGKLPYSYAFEISRYLVNETDYIPWASANNAFNYLDVVLSGSEVYDLFQNYILNLTAPLYDKLGFQALETEEHVTAFHRNVILNLNCRLGNEDCISQAQTLLQQLRDNTIQSLNPDIQTTVFCSGLRGGDADNFNFLWNRYLNSNDAGQLSIYLNALGCTSNDTLREFFLQQVISEDSPVREQDRSTIVIAVINSSPQNLEAGLDFVMENFDKIQPRVQALTGTTNILNTLARRLSTVDHQQKINEFEERYIDIFTAGERASVEAMKENINSALLWSERHQAAVVSWLQENYGSGASAIASSFVIIFVTVLAMLLW